MCFPLYAINNKAPVAQPSKLPEIHLLVDVSGSMRQTDPENLRAKAINMFIYLIKQKALMQIQTFSTETDLMLPLQQVTAEYHKQYRNKRGLISSNGAWTDIDSAINQANTSWGLGKRVIVLLTDGAVDLGSEFRTKQSRNKLTESTLRLLQKAKVRVFTIGFSSKADKDLLANLAAKTNGLSEIVNTSNDLDNVLYSIFTAIIKVDGTPIDTNEDSTRSINIDKNINELTLIFKKTEDISKLFLINPKQKKKAIQELSNKEVSTEHYLVVTIEKPTSGKWILMGPKQEIERAIILTDLNLISNFTSGTYFQGESVPINSYFTLQDKRLSTPLIIDQSQVTAVLQSKQNQYTDKLSHEGNGEFKTKLSIDKPVGHYQLLLNAKNIFFSRQLQFVVDIHESPITIQITNKTYSLTLVRNDLIKEDSVSVSAEVEQSPFIVQALKNNSSWELDLYTLCSNPSFVKQATIWFRAKTVSGRGITLKSKIPEGSCPFSEQFSSELPSVQLTQPSLLQQIPKERKAIEQKSDEKGISWLTYSLLLLLTIIIAFIMWALWLEIKCRRNIERIKTELESETKNE